MFSHHISMGVEYSVEPRRTSGGRYHNVTTSFEYVFVGTDLARAKPKRKHNFFIKYFHNLQKTILLKKCIDLYISLLIRKYVLHFKCLEIILNRF